MALEGVVILGIDERLFGICDCEFLWEDLSLSLSALFVLGCVGFWASGLVGSSISTASIFWDRIRAVVWIEIRDSLLCATLGSIHGNTEGILRSIKCATWDEVCYLPVTRNMDRSLLEHRTKSLVRGISFQNVTPFLPYSYLFLQIIVGLTDMLKLRELMHIAYFICRRPSVA
jgi:hypothetical protein